MSHPRPRRQPVHALAGAHVALGALLLIQPPTVVWAAAGHRDVPPSWIIRLLGIRTLAQGAAETLRPRRDVLILGVAVDAAHAASMVIAATLWPRYRRPALISAGTAVSSAVVGAVLTGIL